MHSESLLTLPLSRSAFTNDQHLNTLSRDHTTNATYQDPVTDPLGPKKKICQSFKLILA